MSTTNGTAAANGHHTNGHNKNGTAATEIPTFTSQSAYHTWLATRLQVQRSQKAFASKSVSLISLPAGSIFAPILYTTPAPKAYTSVQSGRDDHFELNSELVFINHSCDPTLEFDVGDMVVRVARGRELKEGDELTFWYPSSEWVMDQPFDCVCKTGRCKGLISGAGKMGREGLEGYWINDHIRQLLDERDGKAGTNGHSNGVSNGVQNGH